MLSRNRPTWQSARCQSSAAGWVCRSSFRSRVSAIDSLASELARLPGIGRKTALRLTYHLLKQPGEQSKRLAQALITLAERVRRCDRCHNVTEDPICSICRDERRDPAILCVVEEPADI